LETTLKIHCINGSVPSITANPNGSFTVVITPTGKQKKTKTLELQAGIVGAIAQTEKKNKEKK
jgi:hypothetical protein